MRNIYDIISEQKSLVDINIASYELAYVAEEFEYVQEGIGESLKNIVKKIVEFIKTIIRKIKDFVNKVIGHFFKNKDFVKDADERIKEVNANLAKQANVKMSPEQEERFEKNLKAAEDMINDYKEQRKNAAIGYDKQRIDKHNITINGKANDLKGLLKIASGKVSTPGFGPMKTKMATLIKIGGGMEQFEKDFEDIFEAMEDEETAVNSLSTMSTNILANGIRKAIFGIEECDINSKMAELCGDKKENVIFDIKSKADDIYDYLQYGKGFCDALRKAEKGTEQRLNHAIGMIHQNLKDEGVSPENVQKIGNKVSVIIQNACNVLTSSYSSLCRLTTVAYNHCKAISAKVLDAYAINNGMNRKQREEFRKGNQITTKQSYKKIDNYYEDNYDM